MKLRVADVMMNELSRQGLKHVFMLSGGGIMYLMDALATSDLRHVCCHHEQAAAIAAQAYAMQCGGFGACLVTTGPGGVNALTGCAAAYVDSTPVIFISGQVKTADFASLRKVRQFGAQENDIVSMARPVTKYAVRVDDPQQALFELQKALYIAAHGRRGPVWVDVPLDVQSAMVDVQALPFFDPLREAGWCTDDMTAQLHPDVRALDEGVAAVLHKLATCRRPLLYAGHGVTASGAEDLFRTLAQRLGAPVVASWRGLGIMDGDDRLFFGSPGLQAPRYANMITQAADFLLVLGSRLDNMITAFSERNFARRAAKVVVDLDAAEMDKLDMPDVVRVRGDVRQFLERLLAALPEQPRQGAAEWREFCSGLRCRFPLLEEKQAAPLRGTDLYRLTAAVGRAASADDAVVVSSTSRCNTAGHLAFCYRQGQRPVSSMGMGSMGFALPSVVGAWFGSGKKRVIMLEGDGSLQLNIQELQTIIHHGIDAKLFVFSNSGYAAIATMQDRNFDGRHLGSDAPSGVSMPSLQRIAGAYGLPYVRIEDDSQIEKGVQAAMQTKGPVLCEVLGDMAFDEIPKCISHVNAEGKRVSAALENPFPFLSESVVREIFERFDTTE
ncbi:thiamine pyrophosphate-binding protein [Desulfovibrio desulfuricans]|uniref:thiamine pyrophosphate-binding protein n=1 Tax=Desulfovibrio desulfuricans TaxID=876 RepID=UPI0035ADED99